MKEGDIIEPITGRGAIGASYNKYWPNGFVPYSYHPNSGFSASDKLKIRNALNTLERVAPCLKFQEYTSNLPVARVELIRWRG